MPLYIARVEIFDAEPEDYDSLHESMRGIGFVRSIKYSDGISRKLPSGTYSSTGSFTSMSEALEKILKASKPLSSKGPAVIVFEVERWGASLYKDG